MRKKVVFLSYDFLGYEKEVIELMEKVMNFQVYFINFQDYQYKIKTFKEKLFNNFIYKPIFGKNIKDIEFNKKIIEKIEEIGEVDYYFTIRADKFSEDIFKYIKGKNKPMYLHHWDSFTFIDKQEKYLKYFNYISSFDLEECKKYGMKFIPNFYLKKNIKENNKYIYDFFTVMKYDNRFTILEKLGKQLKEKNVKYKFIVITDEKINSEYIEIQKEYISLEKNYEYISKSRGIVEIGHTKEMREKYQGGASFRIADGIGNRKKIITNYNFIKNYDIYNENNICIINNEIIKIEENFLNNPYENYNEEIYNKYSGEYWIKEIFNNRK